LEHANPARKSLTVRALLVVATNFAASAVPVQAMANGFGESGPWQFATPAERQTNAQIADMLERRNGGYYDGFQTTVNNVTNIGTQVNCNNVADANANTATNSQQANSPTVELASGITSGAIGNENSETQPGGNGSSSEQTNSGTIGSSISGSDGSVHSGAIETGNSAQEVGNHQANSGNQSAQINDSTACALNGGSVSGEANSTGNSVESSGVPLN